MDTHTPRTTLAASLLAALTLTGCQLPDLATEPTPDASSTPSDTRTTLAALTIAAEGDPDRYDRDNWPHWTQQHGCDTRERVLITQGQHVTRDDDCEITGGTWVSTYDGQTVTDASELDIDHVVPLGEAAISGTRHWTKDQRETYANDVRGLLAVSAHSNRAKSDRDPAEWLPAQHRCRYVARWIEVKTRYHLTADPAEVRALSMVLETCGVDQ